MSFSVLVPSYKRPDGLRRCLDALEQQIRAPDEVIVITRASDRETLSVVAGVRFIRMVAVSEPGVVAALSRGIAAATGEIVAVTDDDAVPRPDWLRRIEAHYRADATVVGVGGRDCIPEYVGARDQRAVGRVQWWGRVIANHHLGSGEAREVDVLKGVNMSFRRSALTRCSLDHRMLGDGAQVHFELGLCLQLRRRGAKLVYDPAIVVDHHPADRPDFDRSSFSPRAAQESAHNATLALLEYLPPVRREVFLLWAFAVGTRAAPGFLQAIRLLAQGTDRPMARLLATWRGRARAWHTWRKGSRALTDG